MATFVAVHGAFLGGWIWKPLAAKLEGLGHTVHRPTLTGCAEREHVGGAHVDLTTHIRDVAGLIELEELEEVILIGHSYGGMVISGVAQAVTPRIVGLIHLDAFVPHDGESVLDLVGNAQLDHAQKLADEQGDGWRVPFFLPMSKFCADDDPAHAILAAKVRGMPINPFPQRLSCPADTSHLPMLFVYCTDNPLGMFESSRARAMQRPRTQVVDLDARHALMLTRTDEVAGLCHEFTRDR
jgi:pimeloyl-ACP methyl ester carboxylesterase